VREPARPTSSTGDVVDVVLDRLDRLDPVPLHGHDGRARPAHAERVDRRRCGISEKPGRTEGIGGICRRSPRRKRRCGFLGRSACARWKPVAETAAARCLR